MLTAYGRHGAFPPAPARLLDLDHRLPLSAENAADPAKPLAHTVGLSAQGNRKALPIASLKVRYATDGADWRQAAAARGADGRWKVTVPALRTAKVDLRSTVTDALGRFADGDSDRRVRLRLRRHPVLTD